MKRIGIVLILVFAFIITNAQVRNRTSAYNSHRHGKLGEAREYIDKAIEHDKTKDDAKTWFYRGNIYYDIAISKDSNFQKLCKNPFEIAEESYKKAMELDENNKYYIDIRKNMMAVAQGFYNKAVKNFNESDFAAASDYFKKAYDANKSVDILDTAALFNSAVSAVKANEYKTAINYFLILDELNYNNPSVYESLSGAYMALDSIEKAIKYVGVGREKFPDSYNILIAEINLYMKTGNNKQAIKSLNEAIKKDSSNYTIWNAIGNMYDNILKDTTKTEEELKEAFLKSENAYKSAIKYKQDYFDAYYNLGALYVNKAAEIQQEANDLPLDATEQYNKLKKEADDLLKQALPYLERSHELRPSDINTMVSLKEIYTRLGEYEKAKEINQKLQQYK